MSDQGWCWCPHCKKWVPETLMNYDRDDDGKLIRVCTPCLEGTSADNKYVLDRHHDRQRASTVAATIRWSKHLSGCGSSVILAEKHLGGCKNDWLYQDYCRYS